MDRLVLVANTHRVAPGLLSWQAWEELRGGDVCCADAAHPQLPFLEAAGVTVTVLRPEDGPAGQRVSYLMGGGDPAAAALAHLFRERARGGRTAVWLASGGGDPAFVRALGDLVAREGGVELEVVYGSYDLPGARLLDLVATMDRLRSPGGCPWDAEQTHETLAPYLVEETYEALEAVETGDLAALRDELGDVLLQVVFHSRVAQEREDGTGWTVDDVAAGIVEKLVRRHPHVFGDVAVSGADEVAHNWDRIKAGERDESAGVLHGVPLGQPATALAAKLQKRAVKAGLPPALLPYADDALADVERVAPEERAAAVGRLLFACVALARALDVDPEAALRGVAREFRERFEAAEETARSTGVPLAEWDEAAWREVWDAAGLGGPPDE
ncbi:MAG TPA: nucleoside triphosphate pyrophosphohydrolase [Mycobacteriales bacterium]|jgi:XTP/dITP diphosphohydrolase|nr:nucleoside triphosphate pyrophosphohydrolase [Mycobacteriales bacterium]